MSRFRRRLMMAAAAGGGEQYIQFADPVVGQICATNWGDGVGITPSQAAAVTDNQLGATFRSNTQITSFDELRYFTGLTKLSTNAFNGCSSLRSLTLPQNITRIEQYVFIGCAALETLTFMGVVSCAGNNFVSGCGALNRINIPSIDAWMNNSWTGTSAPYSASTNGLHLYLNGESSEITTVVIPTSITTIKTRVFARCVGLQVVIIPSSVTSIESDAFKECSNLAGTFIIPSTVASVAGTTGSAILSGCAGIANVYSYANISLPNLTAQNTHFGNGTGIFYHKGGVSLVPNYYYYDFKSIIIGGNIIVGSYNNRRVFTGDYIEQCRVTGDVDFGTTTGNNFVGGSSIEFLEIMGSIISPSSPILSSCANGCIVHFGKAGVACTPDKILSSNQLSKLQTIYVGDGTNDDAVLALYQADPDWQADTTMLGKLAKWSDYNGDYKTPPAIPLES